MSKIASKQLITTPEIWTGVLTFDTSSAGTGATTIYNSTTATNTPSLQPSNPTLGTYILDFGGDFTTNIQYCTAHITSKTSPIITLNYTVDILSTSGLIIYTYDKGDSLVNGVQNTAYLKIEVYQSAV